MGKSRPKAPDPFATAQAQTAMNRDTAITQQELNMVNQNGPWGSVNYNQSGTTAAGNPIWNQTTSLSPSQQGIFDASQGAQKNMAELAQSQSAQLQETLGNPFSFNNQDAADWAYDLGASRLDPRMAQQQEALQTRLANQGVAPGSRAWESSMNQQGQNENDAYNQLMLNGRSQAFNEALTTYNQPLNSLSALLSGSQVQAPGQTMGATPQTGVAGVDYTGLVNQKYQSDMQNYQSGLGGLFGSAGSLLGAAGQAGGFGALFSDERLKQDVRRVGVTDAGVPIYTYRYIWGGPVQMGVMSKDVPGAVVPHETGFDMVDYGKVI